MLNELINPAIFRKDVTFDDLYPGHIQNMSQMHWTPVDIAKKASNFLAIPDARVLDIGSGVGKFCITAGFFHPGTTFCGIEQREELYTFAEIAKSEMDLPNVSFTHGNLTELDFDDYDHFYFYNPFYENIEPESRIDHSVETSFELYTITAGLFTTCWMKNLRKPGWLLFTRRIARCRQLIIWSIIRIAEY